VYIRAPPTGLLNVCDAFAAGGSVRIFLRCQGEDQGEEAGEEAEEEERESRSQGECQKQAARDPRRGAGSPRGAESGE